MKKLLFSLLSLLMVCGLAWTGSSAVAATAADGETVTLTVFPKQLNESETEEYLYSVQVTCLKKGADASEAVTKTTASEGNPSASFEGCDPAGTYVVTLHKEGYKDTVVETPATEEAHGSTFPVSLNVVMKKAESAPVANGVKVSGYVTTKDYSGMLRNGTATLSSDNTEVATVSLVQDGNRNCYTYEFTEVQSGTYTLSITANGYNKTSHQYDDTYKKEVTVEVGSEDVAQNVELELYVEEGQEMRVNMYINPHFYNPGLDPRLFGVTGTCKKKGAEGEGETKTSPATGDNTLTFACDTSGLYVVTLHKEGYEDTTFETKSWEKQGDAVMGRTLTVVMKAAHTDPQVTLNGAIQIKDHANDTLDKLGTFYLRALYGEGKSQDIQIEKGRYEFDNPIPVGEIVYQLCIRDASYNVVPAKNWAFETSNFDTLAYTLAGADNATVTNNLTVVRVGTDVTGRVVDAAQSSGNLYDVKVKISGGAYADSTTTNYNGFSFSGVRSGSYTLTFSKVGYSPVSQTINVDVANMKLDSVILLDNVAMTAIEMEYAVFGKVQIRDASYNANPLKDAMVIRYSDQAGTVGLDTAYSDASGNWTMKPVTCLADQYLYFNVFHDSIEPLSSLHSMPAQYIASQGGVTINCQHKLPPFYVMKNCKAQQDFTATKPTVKLTWEWPEELTSQYQDENGKGVYKLYYINVQRNNNTVEYVYPAPGVLPVEYVDTLATYQDTLKIGRTYTYSFQVSYSVPDSKTLTVKDSANLTVTLLAEEPVKDSFDLTLLIADSTMGTVQGTGRYEEGTPVDIKATANEGYVFVAWMSGNDTVAKTAEHKITLMSDSTLKAFFAAKPVEPVKDSFELTLNCDATMGSVEGAGKYEKGKEVTIKATANEGYVFVAWMSGNDTVAKTAEHKITLVSDSTLTAVFAKKTANEDREQAAWNVYVEGQTIVLQSNAACQYDVYNLTGALVKRAKTNANEYRIAVNNSGLYIIRRISATGTSVKKVMVR